MPSYPALPSRLAVLLGPLLLSIPALHAQVGVPGLSAVSVTGPPLVQTRLGETFETSIRATTSSPIQILGIRLKCQTDRLRVKDWAPGAGLLAHIDEHGEPPTCDVIIYPDGSQITMLMGLAVPFESSIYGSEWLKVTWEVTSDVPASTCITSETTEDYEREDNPTASALWQPGDQPCLPVTIRTQRWIEAFFVRGDADADSKVNVGDPIRLLEHLFRGADAPPCPDAADVDDDGHLHLADPIILLHHVFGLGSTPRSIARCTYDRTADSLPSCEGPSCFTEPVADP